MIKTYVIDTNVLIQAPYAIECFEENNLVLPLVVLEELDGLKKAEGEKGANARAAVRKLESYRQKGDLLQGVKLPGGGILRIEKNFVQVELPQDIPDDKPDNRILKVCKGLAETEKEGQVILVTKDIVLRLKAQILGIRAEDFERERISEDDAQYTGRTEIYFPEEKVKEFKKKGIPLTDAYQSDEEGNRSTLTFHENEFVILKPDQSVKKTLLGRVSGDKIVPLVYKKSKPYGISPRNVGQYFMQEALMTDAETAPLVIIKGMAGTAKTFYSLAVGLEKVYNNPSQEYRRVIVCRPNAQFDDDIGFLPGDEKEKISVTFDSAPGGLKPQGSFISDVEVAGDDGIFYEVPAWLEENRLIIECPSEIAVRELRYAWCNVPRGNLITDEEGHLASPFCIRADFNT